MTDQRAPHARQSPYRSLKRLFPYARPYVGRFSLGLGSAIVASLLALMIPIVLEWTVAGPVATGNIAAVVGGGLIVLALGVAEALLVFLRRWFVLGPATALEYTMRGEFYHRLQHLPVEFHDRWQGGQLLSRMMQDTNRIRRWIAFGFVLMVTNVITVVVGTVLLFQWHWILGTVFILAGIPLWVQGFVFERTYGALARMSQDKAGDLATRVEESVHGIRVLKAFGRGSHALHHFRSEAKSLHGTEMRKAGAIARIDFWLLAMPDLAFVVALLSGIWLAGAGQITVAELIAYFALAAILRWPMESLGFLFSFTLDAATSADRIFEVFDASNTITDPEQPTTIDKPQGRLTFEGVHFRYSDARQHERDLLNGVDLEVRPGETLALVGKTGSGKTTLTTLPTRLYDVTAGRILLDGVDVRDLRLAELRTHIATAFEDATLFSASVRSNVLLGREDLDSSDPLADDVLQTALDVAQAEFVDALPDADRTLIGEEGMSLSGGQRQRLALARAVAARPSVIVMDDPLSALDVDTEERVQRELRRELTGTTTLVIAHRPSTVALADRVALLEDGKIIAVGPHSDLMATSEEYRNVISSLDDEPSPDQAEQQRRARDEVEPSRGPATGSVAVIREEDERR